MCLEFLMGIYVSMTEEMKSQSQAWFYANRREAAPPTVHARDGGMKLVHLPVLRR